MSDVSYLQFVVFLIAVPALIYAALLIWWVMWEELRRVWKGDDVTEQVWMRASDPRRRGLVTVRSKGGLTTVAVRPDKTEGWE